MAVLAYVLLVVKSGSEREVCKRASEFEEVVEASVLYGEYDAIVKVRTDDLSQLDQFLTDKLREIPEIFRSTTMIVARQYKGHSVGKHQ
jgi:DNA-binding Lrp family transcriptional regulator